MQDADRRQRTEARSRRALLHRARLRATEHDPSPLRGPEAVSLVDDLTRESWALSGQEMPTCSRDELPWRFAPRSPR